MILAAAEGGASRAGYWTGQVLARLHAVTEGRFATHLFAINAVSGGGVGAVGYVSALHEQPDIDGETLHRRLKRLTGADALAPVMAGLLFPDLLQRFLPVAFLPDRAEALERAWEQAWAESGSARPGLFRQPFLSLAGSGTGWKPRVIVQGASQETGRRILTGTVALTADDVDADDFHVMIGRDVRVSTAIHNGARFPWISPAGRLPCQEKTKACGHILDGGYFDPAGVETIRELARRIEAIKDPQDEIRFVLVFIGYSGATLQAQSPAVKAEASPGGSPPPGERPGSGSIWTPLNELLGPVLGLYQSRTAHGAHLMRELKVSAPPAADAGVAGNPAALDANPFRPAGFRNRRYVPVVVCDRAGEGRERVELPLDWALSTKVQDYMDSAAGFGGQPTCGCSKDSAACSRDAIAQIAGEIPAAAKP